LNESVRHQLSLIGSRSLLVWTTQAGEVGRLGDELLAADSARSVTAL
jgi:hypothetical protein